VNPAAPASPPDAAPIRIFFASGGATIGDAAEVKLAETARRLLSEDDGGASRRALIVGHADANGSKAANDRVSAARAEAVLRELTRLGVPPERLAISARGADEPLRTNETAEGRQDNRRVEILLGPVAPLHAAASR
jgi:outer membrane protein OmpA-like peptidoglycan-associated protein